MRRHRLSSSLNASAEVPVAGCLPHSTSFTSLDLGGHYRLRFSAIATYYYGLLNESTLGFKLWIRIPRILSRSESSACLIFFRPHRIPLALFILVNTCGLVEYHDGKGSIILPASQYCFRLTTT